MPFRIVTPEERALNEAAARLREGQLVAFPTETVYGLGAHALDAAAVRRIFEAKGRPASNPVIVHVASIEAARALAARWPEQAEALAAAHWPGPLTLVVEKASSVPDIVTAGGATVGLRIPDHPVALALLERAGVPVAAPSANRSEEVSPTTAGHVADSLGPFAGDLLIIDGGPCRVGIESTVVDVTGETPLVLRPGAVRLETIPRPLPSRNKGEPARSPGQSKRHYAPRKPTILIRSDDSRFSMQPGDGLLLLPESAEEAAKALYAELRRLDGKIDVRRIVIVEPPDRPEWDAIRDRLRRAAA